MRIVPAVFALSLASMGAMAQSAPPQPSAAEVAQGQTILDLTNAWVGARADIEKKAREIAALQAKVAELEKKAAEPAK